MYNITSVVLSWSAENFSPGPIFSENFGPVRPILSEKKGPCPEKKVRRFISNVHVVDISLRVMAEIEETVDDGSDCDDLVVLGGLCLFSVEEVS